MISPYLSKHGLKPSPCTPVGVGETHTGQCGMATGGQWLVFRKAQIVALGWTCEAAMGKHKFPKKIKKKRKI